jgi:hypothetical protein
VELLEAHQEIPAVEHQKVELQDVVAQEVELLEVPVEM